MRLVAAYGRWAKTSAKSIDNLFTAAPITTTTTTTRRASDVVCTTWRITALGWRILGAEIEVAWAKHQ